MAKNLYRLLNLDKSLIFGHLRPKTFFQMNCFSTIVAKKTDSEPPIYTKRDHEFKVSKKATIQTLENLLNLKTFDVLDIISEKKQFRKVSQATLKSNYSQFSQKGIKHETLLKYPEILTVVDSDKKLPTIEKLPYEINIVAVLLLLNLGYLVKFVESEMVVAKKSGKIAILSALLKIDNQKSCECIARKPFLCSLPNDKIEENIMLLLNYDVTPEDIINDLWVLKYSGELIEARLSLAKKYNIDRMKTWMVRAQQEVFQNYIQRRSDNKSILGNSSLAEYISKRLDCSVAIANYLISKQPALKNKSLKKLKENIDFLFAAGFKPIHITRVPKILVHKVETTKKRLKQLEEQGIQIDSLSLLTKSQTQFNQYCEALLKSKKLKSSKS